MFTKDKLAGKAYDSWNSAVKEAGFDIIDISIQMAFYMAPKDEKELAIVKKSALATCDVFKRFYYDEIMKAVDQEKVGRSVGP